MAERKAILLRLDPAVHDALVRWAADDLRSVNAQVELLIRNALVGCRPRTSRREAHSPAVVARARTAPATDEPALRTP